MGLFDKAKQVLGNMLPGSGNKVDYNEDLADFVNKEYEERQQARRPFELQWRLNIEFINGNQFLGINPVKNELVPTEELAWYEEREVFNQVAPIVETRVSRLTQSEPIPKVRPATSDDADISTARVSSMLMQSTWNGQKMDKKYLTLVSWMEATGTVFLKTTWSKNAGRLIYSGSANDPLLGEQAAAPGADTTQTEQTIEIREGDIDTRIVPAYELYADNNYVDGLEECNSVIHARAFHVDKIEEMYGVRVDPEDVDIMSMQKATASGGLGYTANAFRFGAQKLKKHAIVKEYYERPSAKYPKGRFIVVAGKQTLYSGDLPYNLGRDGECDLPFIRCVSIHRPGFLWGASVVERLIPIQRRYNAIRNRKQEYLNMVAIGQWYKPVGTMTDDSQLNNAPGNIIEYNPTIPGAKPEPVQYPSLPPSFENEEMTCNHEFTMISGVSELSRFSNAPTGVKSGVALSVVQQQDDTRVTATASNIANAIVELGQHWIRLYRQFAQEPRLLRAVGDNRDVEVRDWQASDLRSDDVIIENAAALAETPNSRRQMVTSLWQMGAFNDPETGAMTVEGRQKLFQLLEFGNWEMASDDDRMLQRSRAERENRHIKQGQMPQIQDFDDDEVHIKQHNHMRMQAEYEQMIQTPPGQIIDQMMRAHIAEHQQRQAQQQLAAMQMQAMQQPQQPQKQ